MDKTLAITICLCVVVAVIAGCMSQTKDSQQVKAKTANNGVSPVIKASVQHGRQTNGQRANRTISPEAINACAGKAKNDTCGFTTNGRDVKGTCLSGRNGQLSCRPQPRALQPAMLDACAGKDVNVTCEFQTNNATVRGLCRSRGGQMACMPSKTRQTPRRSSNDTQNPGQPENSGTNAPEQPQNRGT